MPHTVAGKLQCTHAGNGLAQSTGKAEIAPSHAHFMESVTNLKKIYASHLALSAQFKLAVEKHEEYVDQLTRPAVAMGVGCSLMPTGPAVSAH